MIDEETVHDETVSLKTRMTMIWHEISKEEGGELLSFEEVSTIQCRK